MSTQLRSLRDVVNDFSKFGFVGFENLMPSAQFAGGDFTYPPSNILVKYANQVGSAFANREIEEYEIQIAAAGFDKNDLTIELYDHVLTVTGVKNVPNKGDDWSFLLQGLAARSFTRHYTLQENIEVIGSKLVNGLLIITLRPKKTTKEKVKLIPIA